MVTSPVAKRKKLEEELVELNQSAKTSPEVATWSLGRALERKQSLLVARAAELALLQELDALCPKMAKALDRLLDAEPKADPNCRAKIALVRALDGLRADEDALFLRALQHVQLEPVWGGREDTASELRAMAAMALVRAVAPQATLWLADLLADPEPAARAGALRAMAESGRGDALTVLRYKVKIGDENAEVLVEAMSALLHLGEAEQVPAIAAQLHSEDEARFEAAALALGQSRLARALEVLLELAPDAIGPKRRTLYLAIAMIRSPAAFSFLEAVIEDGPVKGAVDALEALALARHDPAVLKRVEALVQARNERELSRCFHERFSE